MNQAHVKGRLRNRLNRLRRKVKNASADRQGQMTERMKEIENLLAK